MPCHILCIIRIVSFFGSVGLGSATQYILDTLTYILQREYRNVILIL